MLVPKETILKSLTDTHNQEYTKGFKKFEHRLMQKQAGFKANLMKIEEEFTEQVAKAGAASIYEAHLIENIEAKKHS